MVLRDQSTTTGHFDSQIRRCCGLTVREWLSLIGSLLLPLMLGVFTVVITLHQQNAAAQQRFEDRQLSREQREQDLNISREQRQQDLLMFALQREQDLNVSYEQRKQDKEIAENKRIQDNELAESKRALDNELAERQRNQSDVQRAHDLKITEQQLHDALLVAYMNDIAALLKDNNGSLTDNPTVSIIARAKTLTAIQQLDAFRKTQIIQFLYEAKQLTAGANPLDLSDVELNGTDFSSRKSYRQNFRNLSLAGALLRNSLFTRRDLTNADFSGADLTHAQFNECDLSNADLSYTTIVRTDFTRAVLKGARFDNTHSRSTLFNHANAFLATFTGGYFELADFVSCDCRNVSFDSARLEKSDFSKAKLQQSRFSGASLVRINFTEAQFFGSNFQGARFRDCDFSNSHCKSVTFAKAELIRVRFFRVKLEDTNFANLDMTGVDFTGADLMLATLSHAKLDSANFNGTIVRLTNFSFASLNKAIISDDQLFSAISIRGTILPNGTVNKRDPNMLYNGHADCNHTLLNTHWEMFPSNGIIVSPELDSKIDCMFVNQINDFSSMSQQVNLIGYRPFTMLHRAIYVVTARGGGNISSIRIDDHSDKLISVANFTQGSDSLTLRARSVTYQPKVTVQFSGYGWCDDIELTLETTPRTP